MNEKLKLQFRRCLRCKHKWVPRKLEIKFCPACKSMYWNTLRQKQKRKAS